MTEVEAVLNSRPLSYVSSEDFEEPLTPSHLLVGYRMLSLPDASAVDPTDPDYVSTNLPQRMTHLSKVYTGTFLEMVEERVSVRPS